MDVQKACETLEELLERDTKGRILTAKEFNALNKILLECAIKLNYEIKS